MAASRLRRALFALLLLHALVTPSVTAGYAALYLLTLLWIPAAIASRRLGALIATPSLALLAFVLLSAISALVSPAPGPALVSLRWLSLLLAFPIAVDLVETPRRARALLLAVAAPGLVEAGIGLVQFARGGDALDNRIRGTFSHYMTFSGVTMISAAILLGLALEARGRRRALLLAAALLPGVATLLTFTRGAYLGLLAGAVVTLALSRPKGLLWLPPVVAAVLFLSPAPIRERIVSIGTLSDPTSRERIAMARAGRAMIAESPLWGVGPDRVQEVYPRYRLPEAVEPTVPHLHSNVLQIAAETGVPSALAYLLFVLLCLGAAVSSRRRALSGTPAAAALSAALLGIVAVAVAGLFEYNFGDAEVLMPALLVSAVPSSRGSQDASDASA